jgi:hypothetical protein
MSRFKEKLARVYLITPAFQPEIVEALNGQLGITPVPLSIPATKLAAAWYVPLGASLREFNNPSFDGVNLNNASASDIFFEEHSLSFLLFWRRLTVLVGIFFLATFLIAYSFLGEQLAGLRVQLENSRSQTNARELSELKEKAVEFNGIVAELAQNPRKIEEWAIVLSEIDRIAKQTNVTVDRLSITSFSAPVAMTARAPDNTATLAFKNALSARPGFSQVDVPLLSIRELEDRTVGFSVFFTIDIATLQAK